MDLQQLYDGSIDFIWKVGPNLLLALVVLIIGFWVIKLVTKGVKKGMDKAKIEESLKRFLLSLISIALKALLLISVASMLGIATTSFVAVLGAAGLAVGLSLQGSLSNFAGGVLIILFKPFKVGDVIDAQGHIGSVDSIQVFNTVLKTPDNKTIIIPNGSLSNGSITNYTMEDRRRVDMTFGIGYGDDLKKAKQVLLDLIKADKRILEDPEPFVAVSELADSSVNFVIRVWAKTSDYWGIYFDMLENVKLEFDKQGISIPFPQNDVHIFQQG